MSELAALVTKFVESVTVNGTDIYNEFSLQHELGIFLRAELPGYEVQFERHVEYFAPSRTAFTKREIDVAVFSKDKKELKYAIELKYPRNGQYPEQMFSFCKDIAFAEELMAAGFSRTALLIFADDRLFYSGPGEGIYGHFRSARPITGRIEKPTGAKNLNALIKGNYVVSWSEVSANTRYAFVEVGSSIEWISEAKRIHHYRSTGNVNMDALKPVETPATPARRNPMLADTEPTDEELHLVMCEARDVALQRKQASEIWMREQMENALREAKARMRAHGH